MFPHGTGGTTAKFSPLNDWEDTHFCIKRESLQSKSVIRSLCKSTLSFSPYRRQAVSTSKPHFLPLTSCSCWKHPRSRSRFSEVIKVVECMKGFPNASFMSGHFSFSLSICTSVFTLLGRSKHPDRYGRGRSVALAFPSVILKQILYTSLSLHFTNWSKSTSWIRTQSLECCISAIDALNARDVLRIIRL